MRFIDKTKAENRVRGLTINRQILNSCWDGTKYVNLSYKTVVKTDLVRHLVNEQDGLCCYCMRRLHLQEEENHRTNVTLEHVIPHKIESDEWAADRVKYRAFPILSDRNVTVCPKGTLPAPDVKFGMPPFPHFIAYDNLVASCDGLTLDEVGQEIPHHCCNNKRGNNFVGPLYFHDNISSVVRYDSRGHIICPEEYVPYLDENGVNIMTRFLNGVRLFWKQIADSEYTPQQVNEAEENIDLRNDILDDVFTIDITGRWLFLQEKNAWCVFSDYSWFYYYYKGLL